MLKMIYNKTTNMESNNNSKKNKIIKNKKEEKKTDFPKNKIVAIKNKKHLYTRSIAQMINNKTI